MQPFVITHVLVATDLSDASVPALRYARLFANRFSARLTVVYSEPFMPAGIGPLDFVYVDTSPEHAEQIRHAVEEQAAPILSGRPYDIDATAGEPVGSVLAAARRRKADVIIVGTHLRQGWRRALFESASSGVLHGSTCPVLTVAARELELPYAVTNVLCPVNFSDVARESLHVAARVAEAFGAKLTVVHVVEPGESMQTAADEAVVRRWIAQELQGVCSFRELVARGGAADRVLDCADDLGCDFLVIGAQHKLFRDETVIGATTERLIRLSSSPVLVVPRSLDVTAPRVEHAAAVAG